MLAIIGFGNHVKKNILPLIAKLDMKTKYIVVRESSCQVANCIVTKDYEQVLNDKDVTHIYIATPISTHYELAKKALIAQKNVLCEKTMSLSQSETIELFQISYEKKVKLQEVVMYMYHKQFAYIKTLISSSLYGRLLGLKAQFKIPHLDDNDIRYSKKMGGGALLDVGFYPISAIQMLLTEPKLQGCVVNGSKYHGVDLYGCAIFSSVDTYGIAEWAIGACYTNEIILEFENANISVERAFSKPSNLTTKVIINTSNGHVIESKIPCDDHFENMFKDFFFSEDDQEKKMKSIQRMGILGEILNQSWLERYEK